MSTHCENRHTIIREPRVSSIRLFAIDAEDPALRFGFDAVIHVNNAGGPVEGTLVVEFLDEDSNDEVSEEEVR